MPRSRPGLRDEQGAVGRALPAQAAPAAPTDGKPSCVNVRHTVGNVTQTVYIDNHCKKPVSAIVKNFGADSPCLTAKPGTTIYFKWPRPRAFEGIIHLELRLTHRSGIAAVAPRSPAPRTTERDRHAC